MALKAEGRSGHLIGNLGHLCKNSHIVSLYCHHLFPMPYSKSNAKVGYKHIYIPHTVTHRLTHREIVAVCATFSRLKDSTLIT